jgi:hypothetical protein
MSARTNYTFQFLTRLSALAPILLAACAGETDAPAGTQDQPNQVVAPSGSTAGAAAVTPATPSGSSANPGQMPGTQAAAPNPTTPMPTTTAVPPIVPNPPPQFKGLMQTGAPNHPLATFPTGPAQLAKLCERGRNEMRDDVVINTFCGATPPKITSVIELQTALGVGFQVNNNQRFAFNANTSSLAARGVNAMVPRLVMFSPANNATDRVAFAFSRGEQAIEIIARDNQTDRLNFYFAVYSNACNTGSQCVAGDMLSPDVESNFSEISIYPQQDLQNTILDCNACHLVPAAQGATRVLFRMQELQNPWTHFLRNNTQGGATLLRDYQAMHPAAETYAGVPGNRVANTDPAQLETFVRAQGDGNQPNEFLTNRIEGQVRNSAGGQPASNATPGTSAQWETQYNAALTGQFIPFPYHDVKAYDLTKTTEYTATYTKVIGTPTQNTLPDMRDAFVTERLFEISGINMNPALKGQDLINAACTQCHRSSLDQTLSRSKFNVNLAAFSDTMGGVQTAEARDRELRTAITRVSLPGTDNKKMPPERLRTLTQDQITDLTKFFCSQMTQMDAECQATMATAQ